MDLFTYYKIRWMGFSTLAMAEDGEFLEALRRSNCVSLFILAYFTVEGRYVFNRGTVNFENDITAS